jgi:hypothetical protein
LKEKSGIFRKSPTFSKAARLKKTYGVYPVHIILKVACFITQSAANQGLADILLTVFLEMSSIKSGGFLVVAFLVD